MLVASIVPFETVALAAGPAFAPIVLGLLAVVGLVVTPFWIGRVIRIFNRRRYELAQAFRAS